MLENDLLNTALWLDNPLYADPGHRNGALSFMYLAMITPVLGKRLAPPAIAQSFTKGKAGGFAQHFWNVMKTFRDPWPYRLRFFSGVIASSASCRAYSSTVRAMSTRCISTPSSFLWRRTAWKSLPTMKP